MFEDDFGLRILQRNSCYRGLDQRCGRDNNDGDEDVPFWVIMVIIICIVLLCCIIYICATRCNCRKVETLDEQLKRQAKEKEKKKAIEIAEASVNN